MRPLDDIWEQEQNLAAAEFILGQVREHTNASDRLLIASLAGGRKTMSALLHAAVSHLGRPMRTTRGIASPLPSSWWKVNSSIILCREGSDRRKARETEFPLGGVIGKSRAEKT